MFGEISLLAWMGSAIVFAIGGGAGFFIARQIKDKRTLELEQQLQATQSKLTDYQDEVNRHFLKSSLLFSKLTDNYRDVYEHLATGAQKLCNEKPVISALDLPDTKILSAAVATNTAKPEGIKKPEATIAAQEASETEQASFKQPASEQLVPEQLVSEQHTEEEHLGVESIAAHQTAFEESAETNNTEKAEPAIAENTRDDESAAPSEQTSAEQFSNQSANQAESDTPNITEEELKKLDASEKEKEEADDVHLGAESTPGVELDHHKTHPAIH